MQAVSATKMTTTLTIHITQPQISPTNLGKVKEYNTKMKKNAINADLVFPLNTKVFKHFLTNCAPFLIHKSHMMSIASL